MLLSAVIITYNEERHLRKCLESLRGVADEVFVLDSYSTDQTERICREEKIRFEQHEFDGYISQKNRAMKRAGHDWILSLDGDEALSASLRNRILQWKKQDNLPAGRNIRGYIFRRRNNFCGRWMRFTSWYPDRKLRLFDRRYATWSGYDPHDHVVIVKGGKTERWKSDILHWAIDSVDEFRQKMDDFARITARAYQQAGKKACLLEPVWHGAWRWFKEYIWYLGFLERQAGWQIARYTAINAFRKYAYLRKLNHGYEI